MADRGDELERFKRRLERLRLHHNTCERRFSQSSAMQGQDTMVESTTQEGQKTVVESTTQLDVIREESDDDQSESELSSHGDLDPEYNPSPSSSLSSDEVESPDRERKISREDLKGADTFLSDQPKGKSSLKQQILKTYGKKDQKRYKKEKVSTTVTVKTCTKREDNKRAWDKRHYCLYCGQSNLKIARHLQRKHIEIRDVAYAFSFPARSEERKVLLEQLRNKGDFKHNSKVLEEGKGQLVTWKQPTDKVSVKDYLPCQYCLGMFSKKDLWRHQLSCRCKKLCVTDDVKKARGSVQSHAARLLPIASSSNGCQGIINGMRQDDVSFYIRSDSLICKYGESLYAKHGRMKSRHQYISQRMRELGQFMLVAKEMDKTVRGLEDLCTPSKFNLVVSIAKRLTEFSPRKNEYGKPSKAVKIGFCLKGAVAVLIGQTLMNDDELAEKRAKKFLELLEKNWKDSVSVSAHQSIEEKRWNKQDDIPLTKDVKALMDHLRQVEDEAKEELSKWMSLTAYRTLNEAVLAQVIVFNKRREGEASRLSLEAYKKAGTNPINKDIYESLSPLEKQLSKLLTRIEVRGKRGRKVPVFLTERMKESIELLNKCRAEAGVPVENPYLFARPGVMSNIRGCDCLRKYAKESKAENPELLRSTKLRKQVATLCQLLDLSEQELEQVAKFMGHDIRVHRDFYRQTDKTFQIAKISKLLFAMEQDTRSLTGKNLDTLAVSVGENSSTSTCEAVPHRKGKRDREVDEDEGSEHHNKKSRHSRRDEVSDTDDEGSGQSPGTSPVKSSQKMTTNKRTKTKKAAGEGSDHCVKKRCYSRRDDSGSDVDDQSPETNKRHSREKKMGEQTTVLNVAVHPGVKLKKPWSEGEKDAVHKHLGKFITERRVPGKEQCMRCITAEKALAQRSWTDVKNFVYNSIVTLNRRAASRQLEF